MYLLRGSRTLDVCDLWLQEEKSFGQLDVTVWYFKESNNADFVCTQTKIKKDVNKKEFDRDKMHILTGKLEI